MNSLGHNIDDVEGDSSEDADKKSHRILEILGDRVFHLNIETELPVGAGLGSSASFCVSLSSAFMTWFSEVFGLQSPGYDHNNLEDVNRFAYELECRVHGTPSGIDNTVITYGGLIRMEGRNTFTRLKWEHEPLRVIIVNTNVSRDTKALVSGVRDRYNHPDTFEIMEELIQSVEKIANVFTGMIKEGFHRPRFQSLIEKNHKVLNKMGVGHKDLDRIVFLAKQYDLYGKLTGAGGGGCAFGWRYATPYSQRPMFRRLPTN